LWLSGTNPAGASTGMEYLLWILNISGYARDYFDGKITSDEAAESIYNKMKQIIEE
jgi:hypothetical protein